MKYLCSGKQMQEADRYSIQTIGIPSLVLMERAALAVRDAAREMLKPGNLTVAVCGSGNNGADGMAAARMLALEGLPAEVVLAGSREHMTEECRIQLQILEKLGVCVHGWGEAAYDSISRADLLLDALFGVGLSRNVEGRYAEAVEAMNQSSARIIAVDIPSGVCADDGRILGTGVRADKTVTFGCEKLGQALYPGAEFCGELSVAQIGFAPVPEEQKAEFAYTYTREDLAGLPKRARQSNKGSFGKVAVAAGSRNMAGAAFLCGLGAYRAGSGLVRLVTEEENREILQTLLPEAVMTVMGSEWESELLEVLEWSTVIVLGPGLGQSDKAARKAETVLRYGSLHPEKPVLIDRTP